MQLFPHPKDIGWDLTKPKRSRHKRRPKTGTSYLSCLLYSLPTLMMFSFVLFPHHAMLALDSLLTSFLLFRPLQSLTRVPKSLTLNFNLSLALQSSLNRRMHSLNGNIPTLPQTHTSPPQSLDPNQPLPISIFAALHPPPGIGCNAQQLNTTATTKSTPPASTNTFTHTSSTPTPSFPIPISLEDALQPPQPQYGLNFTSTPGSTDSDTTHPKSTPRRISHPTNKDLDTIFAEQLKLSRNVLLQLRPPPPARGAGTPGGGPDAKRWGG